MCYPGSFCHIIRMQFSTLTTFMSAHMVVAMDSLEEHFYGSDLAVLLQTKNSEAHTFPFKLET